MLGLDNPTEPILIIYKQEGIMNNMSSKADGDYWRHECNRCGNIWYSKNPSPGTCGNRDCRSPYWNKPRQK